MNITTMIVQRAEKVGGIKIPNYIFIGPQGGYGFYLISTLPPTKTGDKLPACARLLLKLFTNMLKIFSQ